MIGDTRYVLEWAWSPGSAHWSHGEYESPFLDSVRVMRDAAMGYSSNQGKAFRIVRVTREVVE